MNANFMDSKISASVPAFAASLARLSETQLTADLPDQPKEGEPWFGYVHDARNLSLFLNLQLNRLASEMWAGSRHSRATEICRQHHRAYRDLTGALVAVGENLFDADPAPGEWPLRTVIHHLTEAELGFLDVDRLGGHPSGGWQ